MSPDDEFKLGAGFTLAQKATEETDFAAKAFFVQKALEILKPLSEPEQHYPKAAFGIGVLAHHMAAHALNNPALSEEERLTDAARYFAQAGRYFSQAAAMPDSQEDFTPARARDSLALLYEQGVLEDGQKNPEKAFLLRQQAAEENFAEAQINLALMYYRGEGTQASLPEARRWMGEAWINKDQLAPATQKEVLDMCVQLEAEIKRQPASLPAPRGPAPAAAPRR